MLKKIYLPHQIERSGRSAYHKVGIHYHNPLKTLDINLFLLLYFHCESLILNLIFTVYLEANKLGGYKGIIVRRGS